MIPRHPKIRADKLCAAYRALQNPGLFKYDHYQQAAIAVCAGILIRLVIGAPVSLFSEELSWAEADNGYLSLGTDRGYQGSPMAIILFCRFSGFHMGRQARWRT